MQEKNRHINILKQSFKWLLYIIVIMVVMIYLLLRMSVVQNYIAQKSAAYISDVAGVEVSIDKVYITDFLKIRLENIAASDHHDSLFLKVKSIEAEVIPSYLLDDIIYIKNLSIDSLFLALIEYHGENELNIVKIIDSFVNENNKDTSSMNIGIEARAVKISNSYFALDLQNSEHFDGMDYTHLNVDSINIRISDFVMKSDSLIGRIDELTAYENCGFNLHSLVGNVLLSPRELEIPDLKLSSNESYIIADYNMRYRQWSDWLDFIDKVKLDAKVKSIDINMDDIRYFSTTLVGWDNRFTGSAIVKGSVANLKVKAADLKYGEFSNFKGSVSLIGLPDFEQTFIRVKTEDSYIDIRDISKFKIGKNESLELPNILNEYKYLTVNGRFTGFYYDFVSKARFNSAIGFFSTDISLQPTSDDKNFKYSGKLKTRNFKIQNLIKTDYVKDISMNITINGLGLDENLHADYNIDIKDVTIADFDYKDLLLVGVVANKRLETELLSHTDSFRLSAKGFYDFSDSIPHGNLVSSMDDARINRLLMYGEDTLGHISGNIEMDIRGNSIDDIEGNINIYELKYTLGDKLYYTDSVIINSYLIDSFREFTVVSNNIGINVNGFKRYSDLPLMTGLLINNVLPKLIDTKLFTDINPIDWSKNENIANEHFNFDIRFLEINSIMNIFLPELSISKNSSINGSYTFHNDSLLLNVYSDVISYGDFRANKIDLNIRKNKSETWIDLSTDYLKTFSGIYFDTLAIKGGINKDTTDFNVHWGGKNNFNNKGDISGSIYWLDINSFELSFDLGEFYLQDSLWILNPLAKINKSYHYIEVSDFDISHCSNNLSVKGAISDSADQSIVFEFNSFDVSFSDLYLREYDTNVDGFVNGKLEFSQMWENPQFVGNIDINKFKVNDYNYDRISISSIYSEQKHAFLLDLVIGPDSLNQKYLDISGLYYPLKDEDNLIAEVKLNEFPLSSIQNYLTSFTSYIDGEATGDLSINGSFKEPVLLGNIKTEVNDILIDYTNVHYSIHDDFVFTKDYFGFINAKAKDINNNDLEITTKISHNYFSDFNMHIQVEPKNAMLINTTVTDNSLFYGKSYGTGIFQLDGGFDDMAIIMSIKPNNKSYIAIPISSQMNAENIRFLTFVAKDTIDINKATVNNKLNANDDFALSLDMEIDIDPTTTVELVMDERTGDIISANGRGKLKIVYDSDGTYKMYGKYNIDKGNYLFTMQNILNKRFIISPGSEILWDGDMETAKINMKAVYKVDAKLYDLFQSIVDSASSTVYKKPSKVNCIISVSGNLFDPTIGFDIEIPDESIADQELVDRLLSVESTGNSEELNKNFVSLLLLGRFQPPSGYDAGANPNMLQHNATEIMAEQVGNILNKVSDDVEIGLEWSPGDDVTTQEVAIALSYSALDDRLLLDGKFGQGGGSISENSDRIVADMEIAYKLTPDGRIRAKAFNRTNYYDPLSRKALYTQGVGITFRKDFNNLNQLFTKKKSSEKTNIKEKQEKEASNKEDLHIESSKSRGHEVEKSEKENSKSAGQKVESSKSENSKVKASEKEKSNKEEKSPDAKQKEDFVR